MNHPVGHFTDRQVKGHWTGYWEWYPLCKNCCMSNDITLSGFIIGYGGSIISVACIHKLISASAQDSYYSFKNQHILNSATSNCHFSWFWQPLWTKAVQAHPCVSVSFGLRWCAFILKAIEKKRQHSFITILLTLLFLLQQETKNIHLKFKKCLLKKFNRFLCKWKNIGFNELTHSMCPSANWFYVFCNQTTKMKLLRLQIMCHRIWYSMSVESIHLKEEVHPLDNISKYMHKEVQKATWKKIVPFPAGKTVTQWVIFKWQQSCNTTSSFQK